MLDVERIYPMFHMNPAIPASRQRRREPVADRLRGSLAGLLVGLSLAGTCPMLVAAPLHHDLKVSIEPSTHFLDAEDTLTLPSTIMADGEDITLYFSLHRNLTPRSLTPGVILSPLTEATAGGPIDPARYSLIIPAGRHSVVLAYEGHIHHPVLGTDTDEMRGVSGTPGIISDDGVYLSIASYWYPHFDQRMLSFSLELRLPAGWDAVSQGERTVHQRDGDGTRVRWEEANPQTDIYLVADRYHEYSRQFGNITAFAFLRSADESLAQRYLEATGRYVEMFSDMLGPYPYGKFALVENFWETGYGMPSFTLLGSQVIRLPFILHTSYPHEILHNWWGNGIYVDYARGNWAEGLTAYLADHLLQEQRGAGAVMRRNHLQRYADYVGEARDFPLIDFRARHSPATEAIGYGKAMMFFHMLRRQLGDEAFLAALREFYDAQMFRVAGYEDLRRAFAAQAGSDLRDEFRQWTIRTGAPRLVAGEAQARRLDDNGHELTFTLEQTQPGPTYRLRVPLAVALEGHAQAFEIDVDLHERRGEIRLELPARPLRVEIDPQFDLFRRVDRREIPPALSQAFGADRVTFVLPATAPPQLRERWRALAQAWRGTRGDADFEIVSDADIDALPGDRAVWLLGWDNRFRDELAPALSAMPVQFVDGAVQLPGRSLQRGEHSAVLVARPPDAPELAIVWLAAADAGAITQLARRLPHYGRYGYLGFGGEDSENILQGQWPVTDSPLGLAVRDEDGKVTGTGIVVEYAPRAALSRPR